MGRRLTTLVAATAGGLLLAGCGSAWPTSDARERFVEHFTTSYPDHVVETITESYEKFPFAGGELSGVVVLTDDTPPEVFGEVLDQVLSWETGNAASFDGVGVLANGVCVFASDDQQTLKQHLRDRLYAEGLALQGTWPCPSWLGQETAYQGSLQDLAEDTGTVRNLWGETDDALRLVAEVHSPYGSVDHVWTTLPGILPDVLTAIGQEHPVKTFELTDDSLRVAVPVTTRVVELQELADGVAGDDLVVEVVPGSLDADKAAQVEALAAVADRLRTVPGVTGVDVRQPGGLVVSVKDGGAVAAAQEAAVTHPDLGSATVEIILDAQDPDDPWARHRYFLSPGGTDQALEVFVALIGHEDVSFVQFRNQAEPSASVELSVPLAAGFPQLQEVLPDGLAVKVTGSDAIAWVEFTSARTLDPGDLQTRFTTPDLAQLARDWNAASSG